MQINKKIAFFGTPEFTVQFLELFKSLGMDIALIVTGQDKPVGRGQQMHSPAPKLFANKNNIPCLQPKKLDEEFFTELSKQNFDLFIVIAYGKIIPEKVINFPAHGTINLHYSLLPKLRGASPVETAILHSDTETGITIQQMVYTLDAGDILFQENIEINSTDTTDELRKKLNQQALNILPHFLTNFFSKKITPVKQDEHHATRCGKFQKQDLEVTKDLHKGDMESVFKKYRAYNKKIFFMHTYHDKQIRVKITEMDSDQILKLLPESRKEISLLDFTNSFGQIQIGN